MFELLGNVVTESALSYEDNAFMESYSTGWECNYSDACDALLYTAMESEQNFNAIMQATMVQEASYFMEHGTEMIYEAADFKAFFGKIKAAVLKAWEKIKAIFKKVFDTIASWVSSDKSYISRNSDDMKKANGTKIDFEGYNITHYNLIIEIVDKVDDYDDLTKILTRKKVSDESIQKDILKDIAKCSTREKYLEYAEKKLGLDKKVTIKTYNADACIEEIKTAKKSKEAANKDYDYAKKLFAAMTALCDKLAREAQTVKAKDKDGNDTDKDMFTDKEKTSITAAAGEFSKAIGFFTSLANSALNLEIKAINVAHDQAKKMTTKALAEYNKKDKKAKNESFFYGVDSVELI